MAIKPIAVWGPLQLPTAATLIYSTPTTGTTVLTRATFINVDTVPRAITVHVVRNSGSVGATNKVISAFNIQPGESYVAPELTNLVLSGGDTIWAFASSATAINATGSGFSV